MSIADDSLVSSDANTVSGANRSTRGAALLGGRQLLTILLSATAAVLLARWLEPTDYGLFATLNLVVFGAATLFGDLGLTVALVRQSAEPTVGEWAAASRLVNLMAWAGLLGGGAGTAILMQLGHGQVATATAMLSVALWARFRRAVPSAMLQRRRRFSTIAAVETVESIVYFGIVLALARSGYGARAIAVAVGVKEVLGYTAYRFAVRGGPSLRRVRGEYRELLAVGLPVQASGLLVALTDAFQPLFIGAVLGLTSLGHVSWAYNLVLMPVLLLGAIDRVVLPSLARVQEDRILLGLLTARAIRLNALISFPVVVAVLVAPSELVSLVFSDQWLPAADLLVLFVPAIVTTAMTAPLFQAFNAIGRTRVAMWLSATWLFLTWTLGSAATWIWGEVGFGWFYVLLQFAYVPVWRLAKRELQIDVIAETRDAVAGLVAGALCGSAVAGAVGFGGRWGALIAGVVVGQAVFAATMVVFERRRSIADVNFLVRGLLGPRVQRPRAAVVAPSKRWRLGQVAPFDGLRAVAVISVMLYHANVPYLPGGFVGVDVFFVLSGFLITALLVQERDRFGRVDFMRFYARRSLRLFPALLAMMAVVTPILVLWPQGSLRSDSLATVPWTLGYLSNYLAMVVDRSLGVFGHTWSLAIEEQFYLLWPPVLVAILHRRSARGAAIFAATGAVVVAVGRALVRFWFENVEFTYFPLHARADALLIGCAGALLMTSAPANTVARVTARLSKAAAGAAVVLALAALFGNIASGWMYVVGLPIVSLASVLVIAQLAGHSSSLVGRCLCLPPLMYLGTVSYGLYLWHFPIFELVKDAQPDLAFRYLVVIQFAMSLAAASISYRFVERPFLSLKSRFGPRLCSVGVVQPQTECLPDRTEASQIAIDHLKEAENGAVR